MKTLRGKRFLALLLSMVLLALCAGSALAAAPAAKASVGGYTLQKTEEASGEVTLLYQGAGGPISVCYSTTAEPAQRLGVRQLSTETLLYACYSDDFDADSIGTIYYTADGCTVTVRGENGRIDKDTLLTFLEAIQAGPIPVATGVCAKCGGEVYSHGAEIGSWKETGSSVCAHGGTVKYKDVQNERSVRVISVCASCGNRTEADYTQSALYCGYINRWYGEPIR